MVFNLRKLEILYQRVTVVTKYAFKTQYAVSNENNSKIGQIVILKDNSIHIEVDNFPHEKKYFSYNLPVLSFEDFERDMSRCGLSIERLPF